MNIYGTLQVDENIIQYEDIMSWLMDAEGTLADVHKRFKYQGQDYKNYKQLLKDFEKRDEQVNKVLNSARYPAMIFH